MVFLNQHKARASVDGNYDVCGYQVQRPELLWTGTTMCVDTRSKVRHICGPSWMTLLQFSFREIWHLIFRWLI